MSGRKLVRLEKENGEARPTGYYEVIDRESGIVVVVIVAGYNAGMRRQAKKRVRLL